MIYCTVDQIESIIKELKHKNFTDMEIICFMMKTKEIRGYDWGEDVVLPYEFYFDLMMLLIKSVKKEK